MSPVETHHNALGSSLSSSLLSRSLFEPRLPRINNTSRTYPTCLCRAPSTQQQPLSFVSRQQHHHNNAQLWLNDFSDIQPPEDEPNITMNTEQQQQMQGLDHFWQEPWTQNTWMSTLSQNPAAQGLQPAAWMYTGEFLDLVGSRQLRGNLSDCLSLRLGGHRHA